MTILKKETKENNRVELTIRVERQEWQKALDDAYQANRDLYPVDGCAPGKATRQALEQAYAPDVFYQEAVNETFPRALVEAFGQEEILVAGAPELRIVDIGPEGFTFAALAELYPEVKLGQYKGLEAPKAEVNVTDEDVDNRLNEMADRNSRLVSVEREIQKGDTADIDFEGFDNGVAFDGGKGENFDLEIGSGSFVPGFEDQLVGMKVGEEKDIDITFPENYTPELAGKPVVFHVKVNKVTETIVPEMDDEFTKDVSEFDTLEALKADIRAKALERAEKTAQTNFETACVDKAAENTTVDLPNALIERELDTQMERFAYQLQMGGYSMEQYAKMMGGDVSTMRNAFRPSAEKQAKVSVTLEKIAEVENVAVTDEEIAAEIESLAKQYEMEADKVKEMVPAAELTESLKTRKAVQIIVDSAVAVAPKAEEKTEE